MVSDEKRKSVNVGAFLVFWEVMNLAEVLDWFGFKGKRCTDFGIYVEEFPPITIAEERVKFEPVLGKSGQLTMLEGEAVFEDMEQPIVCRIDSIDRLNEISAWFFGAGPLVIPNRSGGYYYGRVVNRLELERIIRSRDNRRFTIHFRVEPYFYLDACADIESTAASFVLRNPGSAESAPRIAVYGSGDVSIAIAGQNVLLTGLEGGIIMDTVLQDALSLDGAQLLNNNIAGDFLTIPPGESTLSWHAFDGNDNPGTVTRIVVTPRWRCR